MIYQQAIVSNRPPKSSGDALFLTKILAFAEKKEKYEIFSQASGDGLVIRPGMNDEKTHPYLFSNTYKWLTNGPFTKHKSRQAYIHKNLEFGIVRKGVAWGRLKYQENMSTVQRFVSCSLRPSLLFQRAVVFPFSFEFCVYFIFYLCPCSFLVFNNMFLVQGTQYIMFDIFGRTGMQSSIITFPQ